MARSSSSRDGRSFGGPAGSLRRSGLSSSHYAAPTLTKRRPRPGARQGADRAAWRPPRHRQPARRRHQCHRRATGGAPPFRPGGSPPRFFHLPPPPPPPPPRPPARHPPPHPPPPH